LIEITIARPKFLVTPTMPHPSAVCSPRQLGTFFCPIVPGTPLSSLRGFSHCFTKQMTTSALPILIPTSNLELCVMSPVPPPFSTSTCCLQFSLAKPPPPFHEPTSLFPWQLKLFEWIAFISRPVPTPFSISPLCWCLWVVAIVGFCRSFFPQRSPLFHNSGILRFSFYLISVVTFVCYPPLSTFTSPPCMLSQFSPCSNWPPPWVCPFPKTCWFWSTFCYH